MSTTPSSIGSPYHSIKSLLYWYLKTTILFPADVLTLYKQFFHRFFQPIHTVSQPLHCISAARLDIESDEPFGRSHY